jgi:membrane-bound inhibitor of C-type lysozyme
MRFLTWLAAVAALTSFAIAQVGASETRITEGFGIYPLPGSSVVGHVQVEETHDGTAHFVITLNAVEFGEFHRAVLHAGDCARDQPVVRALETVGRSLPDDRFASLTATDLMASEVLAGAYSVMIYGATVGSEAMACGNVGIDANRSTMAPPLTYACDQVEGGPITFTLRFYEAGIELQLPDRFGGGSEVLAQVAASPGARYESERSAVWIQRDGATIETAGEAFHGCRRKVD